VIGHGRGRRLGGALAVALLLAAATTALSLARGDMLALTDLHASGIQLALLQVVGSNAALLSVSVLGVIALARARRDHGVFAAAAVVGALVLSRLLKVLFHLPRPAPEVVTDTFRTADVAVAAAFVAVAVGLLATRWRRWALVGLALFAGGLAIHVASALVVPASADAFPSSTAMVSGALAFAAAASGSLGDAGRSRLIVGLVVYGAAASISKVLIGDHYPADVLAGWLVALAWVIALSAARDAVASR
jgi:membrane-associated phospholipid phosphatase